MRGMGCALNIRCALSTGTYGNNNKLQVGCRPVAVVIMFKGGHPVVCVR
jgi:hypothetical protein